MSIVNQIPLGNQLKKSEAYSKTQTGSSTPNILDRKDNSTFTQLTTELYDSLIVQFHPRWFLMTMGLGIMASILYSFPYYFNSFSQDQAYTLAGVPTLLREQQMIQRGYQHRHDWLRILGLITFGLDTVILGTLLGCFALHLRYLWVTSTDPAVSLVYNSHKSSHRHHHYYLYEKVFATYLRIKTELFYDITKNVFLGAMAIGIVCWCNVLQAILGAECPVFVFVLWCCCVTSALVSSVVVFPICILQKSRVKIEEFAPTLMLPLVTLMVTSSMGHNIFVNMSSVGLKLFCLIVSFILWCVGVSMCFMVLVVWTYRCFVFKLPVHDRSTVFLCFVPIGFLGQGAHCIQLFGLYTQWYFSLEKTAPSDSDILRGLIFRNIALFTGLVLQGLGFYLTIVAFCVLIAFRSLHDTNKKRNTLNFHDFGWWSSTYPCGTMSVGCYASYMLTGWEFERILSVVYAGILFTVVILCLVAFLIGLGKRFRSIFLRFMSDRD